ncbi:MAG: hypothetical protein Q7J98_01615 [Kiritimatiellia bacterium]|nr:hypothetical protein [Kiritimatiellia bacterium]
MKLNCSLLLLLLGLALPSGSEGQSVGEIGPHLTGKRFQYIGDFYHNYVYLIANEDGGFGGRLADEKYFADTYTVREEVLILLRDTKSGGFAIMDPSDPATKLKFEKVPKDNILSKAWERASNPKNYPKDLKKGKQQEWIYVDLTAKAKETKRFYIGTEIKKEQQSGYSFAPLLVLNEQRSTLFLDPNNRKFALVDVDPLGIPLEEMKYRKMDGGGVADAVWKAIKDKLPKK